MKVYVLMCYDYSYVDDECVMDDATVIAVSKDVKTLRAKMNEEAVKTDGYSLLNGNERRLTLGDKRGKITFSIKETDFYE